MLPIVAMLLASSSSPYATALANAKLLDNQMEALHNCMSPAQAQDFAERIRELPAHYAVIEALNLYVDAESDPESQQIVADALSDALVRLPANDPYSDGFDLLARLIHYKETRTSLHDPRLDAALNRLETLDRKTRAGQVRSS